MTARRFRDEALPTLPDVRPWERSEKQPADYKDRHAGVLVATVYPTIPASVVVLSPFDFPPRVHLTASSPAIRWESTR